MPRVEVEPISKTVFTNTGSFLQTPFWADFKSEHGWKNMRFTVDFDFCGTKIMQECSVLIRAFVKYPFYFSIAYIPLFPKLDCKNIKDAPFELSYLLSDIAKALKTFLPSDTICIRFDADAAFDTPEKRDDFVKKMKSVAKKRKMMPVKSGVDIQPPDSTVIELTQSEDAILAAMKSKWRYNIGLAERKGVVIKRSDGAKADFDSRIDEFYDLYKTTAVRDGIAIHSKEYYADLLRRSAVELFSGNDVPLVSLYTAEHDGESLAAIITLFSKSEAVYLYGCSGNIKRNFMPAYLLQWTAIKAARAYGSAFYDMYGMPPAADESHPMHGLYLFKTGFGGKNIHRIGTFDVPVSGFYGIYVIAEKLRAFLYKKLKKVFAGR
ncbi:MAG: lipid II:glycine glycyltransferase FemX [Treponema sp.]